MMISGEEHPEVPFILFRNSMGALTDEECVIHRGELIVGPALSASGVLNGLVRLAQFIKRTPGKIANAAFETARAPYDWLSREPAVVDAFMNNRMHFGWRSRPRTNRSSLRRPAWPAQAPLAGSATICPFTHLQGAKIPSARNSVACGSFWSNIARLVSIVSPTISIPMGDTKCSTRPIATKCVPSSSIGISAVLAQTNITARRSSRTYGVRLKGNSAA